MYQQVRTYLLTLTLGVLGLGVSAFAFNGIAAAAAAGQIEGGDIYRVRNVTKNTAFTDPASADKCETVQYKVRLHNPGPDPVTSVNVKATLPTAAATSHSSTVTITGANMNPATTTDTAGLNLSESLKITYVAGSTELLDANGAKLSTLPDTITSSGVNVGTVGVSTQQNRFVQFQAKVDCPQQPQPSSGQCKLLTLTVTNKDQREVSAKVDGETTNATITAYRIDFGDNTVVNQQTATHKYAADGTYTVTGYVQVKHADGTTSDYKTAASCKASVTFKQGQPPVVTPPTQTNTQVQTQSQSQSATVTVAGTQQAAASQATPEGLPNVGSPIAVLAGASSLATIFGSLLYRWNIIRRTNLAE